MVELFLKIGFVQLLDGQDIYIRVINDKEIIVEL